MPATPHEAHAILEPAASRVRDPQSGRSLWLAGMIRDADLSDTRLSFTLQCSRGHSADDRGRLQEALERNIRGAGWGGEIICNVGIGAPPAAPPDAAAPAAKASPVKGMTGPGMQPHGGPVTKHPIAGVTHVVAVASGKGGVGKSTVATNMAVAFAKAGLKVGLMDADIYGPSLPLMMNVRGKPFSNEAKKIVPLENHGVKCMSIGFLVDDREPIIWRGPMVMGVVKQFLHDVAWGELDVLLIDLPPGTGDAQLTMIQAVPLSGAVVVTTPQDVAVLDAVRAVEMFNKLDVPILGIIENMAWLELPDGGRMHPFGEGGGGRTAAEYRVPLLAQVPLDTRIREGGDQGQPVTGIDGDVGLPFNQAAQAVRQAIGLG